MSDAVPATGTTTRTGQLRGLLRCSHPRQAIAFAVVIGVLARASDRPWREVLVAAGAVLVVQLLLGLGNDVSDEEYDRRAGREDKPIATGEVPRGNATYLVMVLLLVAIPLSLQNGGAAGAALLITVLVGAVHNRWLHRGAFSWVGWVLTFALLPAFLAYGGWAGGVHGAPPTWQFTAAAAAVGLCVHFLTTLPDLVDDNAAGVRNLPLRIALRTGAPRLFWATVVATVVAVYLLVAAGLDVGLRQ
ncbi:MAG TPA: UbiA family prenyltransferase [Marmoricola sp.]|jgi:4-hydroxybenzoate polyprenyltransferase|nr:UbiA family prenyltransferase [Marmoricola sp.]